MLGSFLVRCGIKRGNYAIEPGLYCVGKPDDKSPVLVSANYKLSFDHLRKELEGINAWILVLNTNGVNVWCAAGKGTFGTDELIRSIRVSNLENVVTHKKLILPQLGATGVAGFQVKKQTGFKVVWGPVYAADIKRFITDGLKADTKMRQVRFPLPERLVLTPVELNMLLKPSLIIFSILVLLSGIGFDGYSFQNILNRGSLIVLSGLIGIISGAILVPLLLPWVPFRSFYLKGIVMGLVAGLGMFALMPVWVAVSESIALVLFIVALSSYLAMNFTGSTPYTSPTGVEREMKKGLPVQLLLAFAALVLWMVSPFAG